MSKHQRHDTLIATMLSFRGCAEWRYWPWGNFTVNEEETKFNDKTNVYSEFMSVSCCHYTAAVEILILTRKSADKKSWQIKQQKMLEMREYIRESSMIKWQHSMVGKTRSA